MSAGSGGMFSSARRLLATVLELAQVRLELVAAEIELEKLRLFDALLLALAALLGLGVGVVLLCGFVIVLAGEAHRLLALGVLSLLFIGGSVWALMSARSRLRRPGTLFDASAAEFARDRAELVSGD
jgi:uncharacterized membrane protein YqjE